MKVGVLGFGHVAAATVESFMANQDLMASKTATSIELVRVATRTPARAQGRVPPACVVSDDCWALVDDPQIDVVLELMGDVPLGRALVLRALSNGKHIVTANKALLALHGEEIMRLADQTGRHVLFEGAVAVSIPIIKTLRESAAANRISSIVGILNGTSNYILSQMSEHGVDFASALADAQDKGFAEANPALDVNGGDAAHKLTLLAALAFGVPINLTAVEVQGIDGMDPLDMSFARRLGHEIKLIAQARLASNRLLVRVQPTLVPRHSMLAQVRGAMNGIVLQGDLMGSAFLYGSGAGGRQTSSAVLADLLELANRPMSGARTGPHNMGFWPRSAAAPAVDIGADYVCAYYIRVRLDDQAGALAKVSQVLADADVSVDALLQDAAKQDLSDLIIMTHPISGSQLRAVWPALQAAAGPDHCALVYPVLGDCGC